MLFSRIDFLRSLLADDPPSQVAPPAPEAPSVTLPQCITIRIGDAFTITISTVIPAP